MWILHYHQWLEFGPPIIVSPESGVAIKEGAKTGLSTVVCGFCFMMCCLFSPLFPETPSTGTMPMLFMVGVLMMQNAKKIKWEVITEALPCFTTIFIVPFTFNLFRGAAFGLITWNIMAIFSGAMYTNCKEFFMEMREILLGDIGDQTEANSDTIPPSVGPTRASEMWFSLEALGFGDIRLPKLKTDFQTVVHNSSTDDLQKAETSIGHKK
jgi:hypothetical protein